MFLFVLCMEDNILFAFFYISVALRTVQYLLVTVILSLQFCGTEEKR